MKTAEKTFHDWLGYSINWDAPRDLNEKINWLKFHVDPYEWARLADKYEVREYIRERGLEDILIPIYGKWNSREEVLDAWDSLPDEFVLKSNNGCGNLMIVSEKSGGKEAVNKEELRKTLNKWLDEKEFGLLQAELHYQLIENCIFAEKLLKDESVETFSCSMVDYKIWCLDGKPYGCLVVYDRHIGGHYILDWYDLEWNQHSEMMTDQNIKRVPIPKPKNWERMLEYAAILSNGHPQVRVDFYNINGKIYFGELTFTSACGYMCYFRPELLLKMGDEVTLDLNAPGNMFMPKKRKLRR